MVDALKNRDGALKQPKRFPAHVPEVLNVHMNVIHKKLTTIK